MKPTLFILAAGMGSRYGGLKQLDGLGPNGETIMDYSVFDALRAGFGKIVFVIREDFAEDFKNIVLKKYEDKVPCEVCFQALDKLPEGFTVPEGRTKPWGTNHAILMAKDIIKEPFAVINADDFYGKEAFEVLAKFLTQVDGQKNRYCMAGYRIENTLSEHGSVNRGVCQTNLDGHLTDVVERCNIERKADGQIQFEENGEIHTIAEGTPVSMNMWGFTPEYFEYSEDSFKQFLTEHGQEMKSEFFIPTLVNDLIVAGTATCEVLDTTAKWFGVTYAEDRPMVVARIQALIDAEIYPHKLF